jgi:protocatechuate 3,4-dioxygenase beta subunit
MYRDGLTPWQRRQFLFAAAASVLFPRRASAAACAAATSRATQGPYWRPGAPATRDLRRSPSDPGLRVRGRVVAAGTCTPVPATLEIWQADQHGHYDVDYGGEQLTFGRASLQVGADGSFEFVTVRPAPYGSRPAHVHYIVNAAGHRPLVTQMYFAGDPHLGSDPLDSVRPDLVVAPRAVRGPGGVAFECTFEVRLA